MKYSLMLACLLFKAVSPFSVEVLSETLCSLNIGARSVGIIDSKLFESGGFMAEIRIGDYAQDSSVVIEIDAYFVVCLDGNTGEPLWKISDFFMGEAAITDVIECDSGMLIAVGATAESCAPEDGPEWVHIWGTRKPLLVLLSSVGTLLGSELPDLGSTEALLAITPMDDDTSAKEAFLMAGSSSDTHKLTLIRMEMVLP